MQLSFMGNCDLFAQICEHLLEFSSRWWKLGVQANIRSKSSKGACISPSSEFSLCDRVLVVWRCLAFLFFVSSSFLHSKEANNITQNSHKVRFQPDSCNSCTNIQRSKYFSLSIYLKGGDDRMSGVPRYAWPKLQKPTLLAFFTQNCPVFPRNCLCEYPDQQTLHLSS